MDQEKDRRERDEGQRRRQLEVLALVLAEHPVRLTPQELQRALGRPPEVEAAVTVLIADGLLAQEGEDLVPTPAALRFHRIAPLDPPSSA